MSRLARLVLMIVVLCALCWFVGVENSTAQIQAAQYFEGTGHWYQAVRVPESTCWDVCFDSAIALGGYLATVTDAAENAFLLTLNAAGTNCQLGGWRLNGSGSWQWVTREPWAYENWDVTEPRGYPYLRMWLHDDVGVHAGMWFDFYDCDPVPEGDFSFIVEYDSTSICFIPSSTYPAGFRPYHMCSADFDEDGDADLVVTNNYDDASSRTFSLLWNDGTGAFGSRTTLTAGAQPYGTAAMDLNNDGHSDLAITNVYGGNISVLLGYGDGTFTGPANYMAGQHPHDITAGDLNGDSWPDLAVCNGLSDNISVLLNHGDGTFAAQVQYPAGNGAHDIGIVDVDGDGDGDLVVANYNTNFVSLFINDGLGGFSAGTPYTVGFSPYSIASGDWDEDGDIDLALSVVSGVGNGRIAVGLNNGNGTFAAPVSYPVLRNPFSVFASDLDGDGHFDLAVAHNGSPFATVLLGNGDGSFELPVNLMVGVNSTDILALDLDLFDGSDLVVSDAWGDNVFVFLQVDCGTGKQTVNVDIKPGSCPNPFELKVSGSGLEVVDLNQRFDIHTAAADGAGGTPVLPVAVLGTAEFDVAEIDPATIMLNGVPALRWANEDVSTPVIEEVDDCACTAAGPDGFMDVTLKFSRSAIAATLGQVSDGEYVPLTLTGNLFDGTQIEGSDCIWIRLTGKGRLAGDDVLPFGLESYPNPFNAATSIRYTLNEPGDVEVSIYNVLGQHVATLVDEYQSAGQHTTTWDAGRAASGVYFYRLQVNGAVTTRQMSLVK